MFAALVIMGCGTVLTYERVDSVRDLAGSWHGWMALRLADAGATLTINGDGTYVGVLHVEGDIDLPIEGAIVDQRPGPLRYRGTNGEGIVMASPERLRFVSDGGRGYGVFGPGGGVFIRAR
jgi:hypothetical protein